MKQISTTQKANIYINTPPFIFGEGLFIIGLSILFNDFPSWQNLTSFIFFGVGGFLIYQKLKMVEFGSNVLKNGVRTTARLNQISDTNITHNSRRVKKYSLKYEVEGMTLYYEFKSAYNRKLRIGDELIIYYLREQPDAAFIPKIYSLPDNI